MVVRKKIQGNVDDHAGISFRGEKAVMMHFHRACDIDVVRMGLIDISLDVEFRVARQK